ncbi:peptidoglycan DD-metalloendopeptidase family protein [Bradyrhizobium yuanmingense]|uniref:peptidoglycan DD-metalloendopeptidase family protein n=1 Tax=Bradyrhizobium yuanmingense TaxID=108015 RepID=UPI000945B020|nr:peptidoglycan DD-metalloendopeptidase family protein [Bradyrhizobium yuanmingense]MCA1530460.1 peptidoglycan DD-metalloendopeptidase family protein [Bradyrhizobium yuanmingense]
MANVTGLATGVTLDGDTLHVDPNTYNSLAVGEHATININYIVTDGNGGSAPQTAVIAINGVNDAPVTLTTLASAPLGSAIEGQAYYDPDINNTLQITNLSFKKQTVVGDPGDSLLIQGNYGTFLLNSDGSYTYWTDPHASIQAQVSDSFSWTVTDGYSTAQSTLIINVTPSAVQFTSVPVGNPIDSTQISQGNLTHETHKGHLSWAYDFLAPKNTDVSAVADGTVVFVQDDLSETAGAYWSGYGNIVTIASYVDGQIFYTTYAHLATGSAGALAVGDVVTEGQVIAKTGDTGTLYKGGLHPHLHIQFGTELYSGTLNNTTNEKGLIADGLNDQVWPAYFEQLDINFNFNGNDAIKEYRGTPGRDVFTANNKGDTVHGYGGDDLLIAGAGADRFVFNKYSTGDTTIENFEAGKDHIVLQDNIRVADLTTTSAGTVIDLSSGGTILLDHVTNYAHWHLLF